MRRRASIILGQGTTEGVSKVYEPRRAVFADHTADPQSWKSYAYVRNIPLRNIDPSCSPLSLRRAKYII